MVTVQVAAHHEVDVLDPEASCLERVHPVGIVFLIPARAQREVLVVADAGIDQDVVMRGLDHIGLVTQYDIAGVAVVSARREPGKILLEGFFLQVREELEHRGKARLLLDEAVDGHVVDAVFGAHGLTLQGFCGVPGS